MRRIIGWILLGLMGSMLGMLLYKAGYDLNTWQFWTILIVVSFCSTVGNELIDKSQLPTS